MSKPKYVPKPQDIVLDFLQESNNIEDVLYVRSMEVFFVWKDGWYEYKSDQDLAREMYKFCLKRHSTQRLSKNFVKDLIEQLKWQVIREIDDIDKTYICFDDCLLNTKTWETEEHSRDKVSTFYLPYNYKELTNDHPIWDRFLATSLVTKKLEPDEQLAALVQEMFGDFLFLNVNKRSVAYFLVGSGANGKSIMLDVATNIIGKQFISAMNIETLTTRAFYLPHLIGKRINISNEEESKFMKADKFKALVTGEPQTADRKFGDAFTFTPDAKFVFASNKIPTFSDLNYGITRRIKIIPFHQRFDDDNPLTDIDLPEKLKAEYGSIIKWAIAGAIRLQKNKFVFSKAKETEKAMADFQSDISSAVLFIRENYVIDPKGFTSNIDLYSHYRAWCDEVGKKPMSQHNFSKDILVTFTDIESKHGRDDDGDVKRGKNLIKQPGGMNQEEEEDIETIDISDSKELDKLF